MPALPAYEAFLHQASVGLLLPILDQPSDIRRRTIYGLNCRKLSPSFSGGDPNWGRILAAAGRAGFPLDQGLIGLAFDDIEIVRMDTSAGKRAEDLAKKVMVAIEFTVILDLGLGQEEARILTSDLSIDYVRINADYRT
jgi:glutamate N-acetyltransferase/amino-acid N-acetyltransferase